MDDQPPHTVKDLLVELKDASELMVDLAYAAVFFNDDKIADAIQRICAAASDVARVVAARLGIPDALRPDLHHADEMTARVRVRDDAPASAQTLAELSLPTETGMWV